MKNFDAEENNMKLVRPNETKVTTEYSEIIMKKDKET